MCERFDRNQYQIHMRNLDSLKQTGSVDEYYNRFVELAHQILLYNPAYDHVFFVTRFLNGLRDEIRSAITLHRPKDVETAAALALLQESELENGRKKSLPKTEAGFSSKTSLKTGFSYDKAKGKAEFKSVDEHKGKEKLDVLKAYRREKGLCFKCGEKWNRQHQCPQQVPLHIIEELLEVLDYSDEDTSDSEDLTTPETSSLMAVSDPATTIPTKRRTMQLRGMIGKQEVLALVDSGSISSFISSDLVKKQQLAVTAIPSERFTVADGNSIQCTGMVKDLQWWTQGHSFTQDIRVLDLGSFDIILGEDWLETHSPMCIHWRTKKMHFTHLGKRIMLRGLHPDAVICRPIQCRKLKGLLKRNNLTHMVELHKVQQTLTNLNQISEGNELTNDQQLPPTVQEVLDKFPQVFKDTTQLPPHRTCDHTIQLVPGAQPVNARAYRLPPDQKDEVEKQLREMLQKGLIHLSSNPFASPVLLVRKKDGTWRFA